MDGSNLKPQFTFRKGSSGNEQQVSTFGLCLYRSRQCTGTWAQHRYYIRGTRPYTYVTLFLKWLLYAGGGM